MKQNSARRIAIPRPDLMAMTDLVFLLVVFFMINMAFSNTRALPADLKSEEGAWMGPVPDFYHVEIFIDSKDQVWVEDHLCQTTAEISNAIQLEMSRLGTNVVQIEIDGDSVHGTTVRVVDAATGVRVRSIRMKLGECFASSMQQAS